MAGTDKTGKSAKISRNERKCQEYRARNNSGNTAKARRVRRALLGITTAGPSRKKSPIDQIGWVLTQDRKRAIPIATKRKKRGG